MNSKKDMKLMDILSMRVVKLREYLTKLEIDPDDLFYFNSYTYIRLSSGERSRVEFTMNTLKYNETLLFDLYNKEVLQ